MEKFDIVILTEARYINLIPDESDDYAKNVLKEDRLLKEAFKGVGLNCVIKAWDDPFFQWEKTRSVIFRTTWDYFHRFEAFGKWMKSCSEKCKMFNSYQQILWNIDKHYLNELSQKGIRIPPSLFIPKGESRKLAEICRESGWQEFILKPTVSGAARHTYKFNQEEIPLYEEIFSELISKEDMMLQEYLESITSKGEISLMLMGGNFTHAVHKMAKPGDFRVQDDFGGTVHDYTPQKNEIVFAEKSVSVLNELPAYARVDLVWNNKNELCLSELEMIEPELWFRKHPQAAKTLAEHIFKILTPS